MNFYREFFKLTFEICLAVFIIIFSYTLWNTFDKKQYEISEYYQSINKFELYIEDETDKLYLHNIGNRNNIAKLSLKTNKNTIIPSDIAITIDNKNYYFKDLECLEDEYYCYYIINNFQLEGYETKEYNYFIINDNINYELVATI